MATTEDIQYAIYAKNGNERKVLFILKPHYRQVTYTKYGVQELNLDHPLPNYIDAVKKLFSDLSLVHIPFRKGRMTEEINELIKEQIQTKSDVSDMNLCSTFAGPIDMNDHTRSKFRALQASFVNLKMYSAKTATYNKASQTLGEKKNSDLNSLFGALNGDLGVMNEILNSGLAPLLDDHRATPKVSSNVIWGKNRDYIIDPSIRVQDVLKQLNEQGFVRYIVSIHIDGRLLPHTMVIMITPTQLTIVDPCGLSENTRHVYYWANQVINYLNGNGYHIIRNITADHVYLPQLLCDHCQNSSLTWAFYYLWLSNNNPSASTDEIERHIMNRSVHDRDFSTRVAYVLYN
jgi:hypothetical protein